MQLTPMANGFYLLYFDLPEDRCKALLNGPTIIFGHILSIRLWEPRFNPNSASKDVFSPVWIRLHGLPTEYYDRRLLVDIGNALGSFLGTDEATHNVVKLNYARVCILRNLSIPLPMDFTLDGLYQPLSFEGNLGFCSTCNNINHQAQTCQYTRGNMPATKPTPTQPTELTMSQSAGRYLNQRSHSRVDPMRQSLNKDLNKGKNRLASQHTPDQKYKQKKDLFKPFSSQQNKNQTLGETSRSKVSFHSESSQPVGPMPCLDNPTQENSDHQSTLLDHISPNVEESSPPRNQTSPHTSTSSLSPNTDNPTQTQILSVSSAPHFSLPPLSSTIEKPTKTQKPSFLSSSKLSEPISHFSDIADPPSSSMPYTDNLPLLISKPDAFRSRKPKDLTLKLILVSADEIQATKPNLNLDLTKFLRSIHMSHPIDVLFKSTTPEPFEPHTSLLTITHSEKTSTHHASPHLANDCKSSSEASRTKGTPPVPAQPTRTLCLRIQDSSHSSVPRPLRRVVHPNTTTARTQLEEFLLHSSTVQCKSGPDHLSHEHMGESHDRNDFTATVATKLGNADVQCSIRPTLGGGDQVLHASPEIERPLPSATSSHDNQFLSSTLPTLLTSGPIPNGDHRLSKTGEDRSHNQGAQTQWSFSDMELGTANYRCMRHALIAARNGVPGLQVDV